MTAPPRVLLLVPARSYRAADFILAAERMRLDLVVASDGALPLGGRPVIPVSPADPGASARRILAQAGPLKPVDAVVAADTPMLVLAATVAAAMGLPHNPVDAVRAATDKAAQRQRWAAAGLPQPSFRLVPARACVRQAAEAVGFPCVVKAVSLSASQGVLRADDPAAAVEAARRIRKVLDEAERPASEPLLIEEYLPGPELSIDGDPGRRRPGRYRRLRQARHPRRPHVRGNPAGQPLPAGSRHARRRGPHGRRRGPLARPVDRPGARRTAHQRPRPGHARTGRPVHRRAVLPRTPLPRRREPGGDRPGQRPGPAASPRPRAPSGPAACSCSRCRGPGILRAVEGRAAALAVPGITGLTITIPPGQRVRPLPDGDRYLGFVFAEGGTAADVEHALTTASRRLRVIISDDRPGCRPSS